MHEILRDLINKYKQKRTVYEVYLQKIVSKRFGKKESKNEDVFPAN